MKKVYSSAIDLCHDYFYKEHNEECKANNAWFQGNRFGYYATCLAYIYTGKDGRKTLLMSDSNMGFNLTSKVLNMLRDACSFNVAYVPFEYRNKMYYEDLKGQKGVLKKICSLFTERLENEIKAKESYTRQAQRDYALELLKNMNEFVRITGCKIKGLAKYNKYLSVALNSDNIKKRAALARERTKKLAEKQAKFVEKMKKDVAKKPILDVIKYYVFDFKHLGKTANEIKTKELFNKMFDTGSYNPSYVILDKDNDTDIVRTSQGIKMPVSEVIPLLKLWKHKQNILGQKLRQYDVVSNNNKYVKIGCHAIPIENIKALAEVLL